ncbi:hypothetical protein GIB67_041584 [Kingdonia uniflora]|uniref:Uncharacterized protein n=1 Tax=Kingdonia uniflora TaxID=39325 RepID=A0A7J7MQG4_9MAGN|nr:hypothetical protein GIB67_041584 [Kingdonia uniflora]
MFHLPPEEWDALIKINENVSTFRKSRLPHEDLMKAIFANRVATGQYATGPTMDDFISMATLDVVADLILEDENNVPTNLAEGDTDTYFIDHHFEPSGVHFVFDLKPSLSSLNQNNLRLITLHSLYLNQCHPLLSWKVVTAVGRKYKKLKTLWIS